MRSNVLTASILAATALGGAVALADDKAAVDAAIATAEAELAAAADAGHVWRLIDPASGGKSVDIDKLLAIAREKRDAGELDEATRIADRVTEAAVLGQQQARSESTAAPSYPEN